MQNNCLQLNIRLDFISFFCFFKKKNLVHLNCKKFINFLFFLFFFIFFYFFKRELFFSYTLFFKKNKKKTFIINRAPYRYKLARNQLNFDRFFFSLNISIKLKLFFFYKFYKIIQPFFYLFFIFENNMVFLKKTIFFSKNQIKLEI